MAWYGMVWPVKRYVQVPVGRGKGRVLARVAKEPAGGGQHEQNHLQRESYMQHELRASADLVELEVVCICGICCTFKHVRLVFHLSDSHLRQPCAHTVTNTT